ncbi:MAG TPA: glutamine-hydrolyzing carbamoyl-phosphate synthase small subunit [Polyangia bacterium]|nr:glutamine-hydrolyzing carbamoyl-phosphate synthase small subunit [Polyangia bacterium]
MSELGRLALEDGTVLRGTAFGARGETSGEVVFNTALTGYQEVLTDPSYRGQIVAMTAPEIGNVGTNPEDDESPRAYLSGFVVRELSPRVSSWRAATSLSAFLARENVIGLAGVDTRALTRRLRERGSLRGVISTDPAASDAALVERARAWPGLEGRDLVREVTTSARYRWDVPSWTHHEAPAERAAPRHHVVAYDFGIKRNILRRLVDAGCVVTVVPADTPAREALALGPDGIFLSNGPGDPAAVGYAIAATRELLSTGRPLFGICLGHQILGLALGGSTYKLKFGHHGANQPVLDIGTGKVEITSQNHGFAVDVASLEGRADLSHVNLNDGTVEGLRLRDRPVFSVQYHPEASPGPHDAGYLFARFVALMDEAASARAGGR